MSLDGYSCGRSTPSRHMDIDLSWFGLTAFLLRDWVPILLVFETCWDVLRGQGCCSRAAVVVVLPCARHPKRQRNRYYVSVS